MPKALLTAAAGTALLAAGAPLLAHHAFSAEYDAAKPVTVSGKITRLEWNNPHVILLVAVATTDGAVESWRIEAGSPGQVKNQKVSREMLAAGTRVVINGYGSKDGRLAAWGRDVTFADGTTLMLVIPRDDPQSPRFSPQSAARVAAAPITFAQRVDAVLPYGLYGVPVLVLVIGLWQLRRQKQKAQRGVSTS